MTPDLDPRLLDLAALDREAVRRGGLIEFMRQAWSVVEPEDAFLENWHHGAMAEHVQAVIDGELRNLLINVPPGFAKSLTVSVLGSAFAWTRKPGYRVLAISHSLALARRDSRKTRTLLQGEWYQARWGHLFDFVKDDESRLENDRTGFRIVGSTVAGVTGERGNLVLVDDPLDREQAESETHRRRVSEFFWETLPTRVNDFKRDGKVVIMQRLHERDTSGEILERAEDNWEKLVLPNEYDPKRAYSTSLGFRDPRVEDGELLHPERIDAESTAELKSDAGIGAYAYAGQYGQRPAPREGALLKRAWFARRFRERGRRPIRVIQSWDTAKKAKESNDPTAGGTLAEFDDHLELWDVRVERLEFPDLLREIKDAHASTDARGPRPPNAVLIEDKGSGESAIQQLRKDTKIPVVAVNPGTQDKYVRMSNETAVLEAGNLWLPEDAPWVAGFLDEVCTFPGSAHDDRVDMLSQVLRYVRESPARRPSSRGPVGVPKRSNRIRG